MIGRGGVALGPFLQTLERRLGTLEADEIREALLVHATRLPPSDRPSFLAIFAAEGRGRAACEAPDPAGQLLAEIDAFVQRLSDGAYVEGWGWDPDLHEERAFGDESWAGEMDDLLTACDAAFLDGDLALARAAYGRLLNGFRLSSENGAFCGPSDPEEMLQADVGEAKARYLRALYEATPPTERASRLLEEMGALRYVGGRASLRAVSEVSREELPGLDAFLPAWIEELRSLGDAQLGREVSSLLSEAAEWQGGADGLGSLAREHHPRDAELYRDWVDALAREGRIDDAAAAAREALGRLEPLGSVRAAIANRLARLVAAQGDGQAVLEARRESWRSAPSARRLLDLIDTAIALGCSEDVLSEESERTEVLPDALACELLLLAGRVAPAVTRLEAAPALGWTRHDHPGPIVVPYLLVAATGGGPPEDEGSLLAREFEGIDHHASVRASDVFHDDNHDVPPLDPRFRGLPPDELLPSRLLAGRLASRSSSAAEDRHWLAAARGAVERRTAAIVEGKHRRAYERAARLVVACAEASALTEGRDSGSTFVATIRNRYPRHVAFRSEIDAATRQSPFLPSPPLRGRR